MHTCSEGGKSPSMREDEDTEFHPLYHSIFCTGQFEAICRIRHLFLRMASGGNTSMYMMRMIDGNFGNVSAGVLISKVAY